MKGMQVAHELISQLYGCSDLTTRDATFYAILCCVLNWIWLTELTSSTSQGIIHALLSIHVQSSGDHHLHRRLNNDRGIVEALILSGPYSVLPDQEAPLFLRRRDAQYNGGYLRQSFTSR